MKIFLCASGETTLFAANELSRLICGMGNPAPEIVTDAKYDASVAGLYLGLFSDFPHLKAKTDNPSRFDDEIQIEIANGSGVIAGLCPRSILIAIYRFASELGCKFVTVGKIGEKLVKSDISCACVSLHETPSYRHRGVCIEGSVSIENVAEMIDFLPKVGMNSYFLQFRESHTFYDRWYSHTFHPTLQTPGSFSVEDARGAIAEAAKEMSKRGILYHAVGHGWTCEPFGVAGLGWDTWTEPLSDEAREAFAMVNGKRDLWGGIPINTQACFSNPTVRKKILENICEYIHAHPTVDVLHFWLGDGFSNHCECDGCKKHRPSDFYVMMLNELDEMLEAQGLNTRIVFLIYVDLLWPPVEFKLNNPDRFLIMFAPITRTYRASFRPEGELPQITDYQRNAGWDVLPVEVSMNVAYLNAWQKIFGGDGFDYDYHYMWAHIKDPGCINLARTLSEDIFNLKNLGLNGFISCQLGRVMFPNALNMVTMGKTLWNRSTDFDALCEEYFADCYGDDAQAVLEYMTKLSDMYFSLELERAMWRLNEFSDAEKKAEICLAIIDLISEFTAKFKAKADGNTFFAWLMEHAWIYSDYTRVIRHLFLGENDTAFKLIDELCDKAFLREDKYQSVFDPWEFAKTAKEDLDPIRKK